MTSSSTPLQLVPLGPDEFEPHPLHRADRDWTETNCWQDMMIEVLHLFDLDPVAASAFSLSTDFEGSQWTLFKYPPEDLRTLFGLEIAELYVWRPVIDHLEIAFRDRQLLTIEVDAFYLPDTAGVTYQLGHVKTGIVPQMLDRQGRRMWYFHNAGYFELSGDDFDAILQLSGPSVHVPLPYVEVIRLDRMRRPEPDELRQKAVGLTREHLLRRPSDNPMPRFREHLCADLPWLEEHGEAGFHPYAFATCRQCGASAELAAAFLDWLDEHDGGGLAAAAQCYREISSTAKSLQFALARVARHRKVDLDAPFERMGRAWQEASELLASRYLS
ncbi:MAG: DUF1839 family protein [Acidimicrobiales bacterium]